MIANACDAWNRTVRWSSLRSEWKPLRDRGFDPIELDLRHYLGRPDALEATLRTFPALWVRGGNTFVLRRQLARCGGDEVLRSLLSRDELVYAGYSAGACLLGPTLRGLEFSDPPAEVLSATGCTVLWDGLGVIDRAVIPHWRSPFLDPDDEGVRAARALTAAGVPYLPLTDEQILVVDGDRESVLG